MKTNQIIIRSIVLAMIFAAVVFPGAILYVKTGIDLSFVSAIIYLIICLYAFRDPILKSLNRDLDPNIIDIYDLSDMD